MSERTTGATDERARETEKRIRAYEDVLGDTFSVAACQASVCTREVIQDLEDFGYRIVSVADLADLFGAVEVMCAELEHDVSAFLGSEQQDRIRALIGGAS